MPLSGFKAYSGTCQLASYSAPLHNAAMKIRNFFKGGSCPSALALIAANTIPISGAIFLGWSIFSLMFLFWLENVIIGVLNVVRLLAASSPFGERTDNSTVKQIFMLFMKLFLAAFFVFHYGGFCFVHGMLIIQMFGKEAGVSLPQGLNNTVAVAIRLLVEQKLLVAAISIFISHLFSLSYNYFYKGERHTADTQQIMGRPYGRIMVLHITIIFGGLAVMALGSPIWALALLVLLKTIIDLKAHLMERSKMQKNITYAANI